MVVNYFRHKELIFKNYSAFEEGFEPASFQFRDEELAKLATALLPALHNASPQHTLLYGLPGTGKTTSTLLLLGQLSRTAHNVVPVYLDCQNAKTPASVLRHIFSSLSHTQLPPGSRSLDTLCDRLGTLLARRGKTVVICLDDINLIRSTDHLNEIIARLSRMHLDFPDVHITIIAIVNEPEYDIDTLLEASTRSRFRHTEIPFPFYSKEQMLAILTDRAGEGYCPNVISPELIQEITDVAFSSGDLRIGMDLLCRSGLHAEKAGRTTIEEQDVRAVTDDAKNLHLFHMTGALTLPEQDLLTFIADQPEETDAQTIRDLYQVMTEGEEKKISYATFHNRINRLEQLGLIETNKKNLPTRGRVTEVKLCYEAQVVQKVCGNQVPGDDTEQATAGSVPVSEANGEAGGVTG